MNVMVVHIDINVSQHDYGVLTPNIASGNKLSDDCKKLCFTVCSVCVCVPMFAAECSLQCTEALLTYILNRFSKQGFSVMRVPTGFRKKS
jgi:hypothetical protein